MSRFRKLRLVAPVLLSAVAVALTAAGAATAVQAQSAARPLNVQIDHTTRVQLRGAASSVIVANPDIADVSVVDANTLFIIGRGYGATEVVALDSIGRTLFQGRVLVGGGDTGSVRVWRGGQGTEMACSTSCSPSSRALGSTGTTAGPR